jgi:SAM-dependent methyltransferase
MGFHPDDDQTILDELVTLAERPERDLLQFRSQAGAHQYLRLYRTFRRQVPAGSKVLDWGSGNGHFSYFLGRAGYRATGFSLEGYGFESWLCVPHYRFVAGSLDDPVSLPFECDLFDAVASVGVLEHVRETGGDEVRSLREIARCMRPGGIFVCYHFPNRTSWIDWLAARVPGKHHHRYRYDRAAIAALVDAAGLELLEVERYGILPRNSGHLIFGPFRKTHASARLWDWLDGVLGAVLAPLCQNFLFVARKPASR